MAVGEFDDYPCVQYGYSVKSGTTLVFAGPGEDMQRRYGGSELTRRGTNVKALETFLGCARTLGSAHRQHRTTASHTRNLQHPSEPCPPYMQTQMQQGVDHTTNHHGHTNNKRHAQAQNTTKHTELHPQSCHLQDCTGNNTTRPLLNNTHHTRLTDDTRPEPS